MLSTGASGTPPCGSEGPSFPLPFVHADLRWSMLLALLGTTRYGNRSGLQSTTCLVGQYVGRKSPLATKNLLEVTSSKGGDAIHQ